MFFTLQYNEVNEKYRKTVARVVGAEFGFEIYVFENCNGKSLILQTFKLSHERTLTINRKKFPTFIIHENYRFISATIQIWTDSYMYKILLIFNILAHGATEIVGRCVEFYQIPRIIPSKL